MARPLKETPLTTRVARNALAPGLYWRAIDHEIHLGYRKGRAGGKWLVRYYIADAQTYRRINLGVADDAVSEGTLSYAAAVLCARAAVEKIRHRGELEADLPIPTVRQAVLAYNAQQDARESAREGRETRSATAGKLRRHVLGNPPFADISLDQLTDEDLSAWLATLDPRLKATTRQRIVNALKAALNAAYRAHRKRLPRDFAETVRVGLKLEPGDDEIRDVVESQILTDDQVRGLVAAAFAIDPDHDFGRLVLCLAATGARFSQLKRMKVRDVQPSLDRLMVPRSRKGRNKRGGYTPIRVGADVIAAMMVVVEGRSPDEPLFCRWRRVQVSRTEWRRDSRGPWKTPSEMLRPWATACRRAGITGHTPYALRHSSIVRGIREGLPIRLVAAIHDTSVAMIEAHYGRWIADGLEELAARAIVPMMRAA